MNGANLQNERERIIPSWGGASKPCPVWARSNQGEGRRDGRESDVGGTEEAAAAGVRPQITRSHPDGNDDDNIRAERGIPPSPLSSPRA